MGNAADAASVSHPWPRQRTFFRLPHFSKSRQRADVQRGHPVRARPRSQVAGSAGPGMRRVRARAVPRPSRSVCSEEKRMTTAAAVPERWRLQEPARFARADAPSSGRRRATSARDAAHPQERRSRGTECDRRLLTSQTPLTSGAGFGEPDTFALAIVFRDELDARLRDRLLHSHHRAEARIDLAALKARDSVQGHDGLVREDLLRPTQQSAGRPNLTRCDHARAQSPRRHAFSYREGLFRPR